ncbi:metallophosphoesterase family protein [Pararhizobium mangrovi]|uniref:Metallophosphoesterase n=1 Tax=Pararhizobium mangrovi TaxID=2590452 RepID=A0A506UHS1_9HYPH|nr:metallophosphoesterase [Pararhizobium mangrovi]TPW32861.1 metallophosphoesterase [Pararhizobium mangrovi]
MYRLSHISDVHLGPLPSLSLKELASKRITGYVNWRRNRRKLLVGDVLETLLEDIESRNPDHLAITGDLMNLSTKDEITATHAWLEATGDPHKVSIIPGNHDAYVPGAYERICKAWRPWMSGDEAHTSVTGDKMFPYIRIRDNVALIGISTANATPPFLASGYFGRGQARRTVNLLHYAREKGLFRVVMIHHPPMRDLAPWHKRLIGIRRFAATISTGGAELVLHGHTHEDTMHWLHTRRVTVPVVGVPSASQGAGGRRPPAGHNLFVIEGEPGAWQCRRESYRFQKDMSGLHMRSSDDLSSTAVAKAREHRPIGQS